MSAKPLVIEIASDVICPWCYIGKRRLEKALALLDGEVKPEIRWLPFQLNPDMPKAGIPRFLPRVMVSSMLVSVTVACHAGSVRFVAPLNLPFKVLARPSLP